MNRRDQIARMRMQQEAHKRSLGTRVFDWVDHQMDTHPVRTIGGAWLLVGLLNLVFWGAIIFMIAVGLNFVL